MEKVLLKMYERDFVVVGISKMLVFWSLLSLVRNSVVLAVCFLFSVACFFTVHEHYGRASCRFFYRNQKYAGACI